MGTSKAQVHMRKCLQKICDAYNITLITELKSGDKRYDFYIPTYPPLVIEINGSQHTATKIDGHFFKTEEQLEKYKTNDFERRREHKLGKINLITFSDREFPSISELIDTLDKYLKNGEDENNANLKRIRNNQERDRRNKEYYRELRERAKKRNSSRD
jgi:hypothetical protein